METTRAMRVTRKRRSRTLLRGLVLTAAALPCLALLASACSPALPAAGAVSPRPSHSGMTTRPSPGAGQVQPPGGGPGGGSLPGLGTPFTPSGHPPTSLPSLPGSR